MQQNEIIAYLALEITFGAFPIRVYRPATFGNQDASQIFLSRTDIHNALAKNVTNNDVLRNTKTIPLFTNLNELGIFQRTNAIDPRDLYQQFVNHKNDDAFFTRFFECLKYDKSELFSHFLQGYCENDNQPKEQAQPPEEIALALEMVSDMKNKCVGTYGIGHMINQCYHNPELPITASFITKLNMVYLSIVDGCLFIGDLCPLLDYDLLSWHPDAQRGIPHQFCELRPATMIRLFDSLLDIDTPY